MKTSITQHLRIFGIVTALGFAGMANAGLVDTTIWAGANIYIPSIANTTSSAGKGLIGGVGFGMGVGPVSVIGDILYAKREVGFGSLASNTLTYIHVPVQAQLGLGLFHVSGGMYYAQGLGDVSSSLGGTSVSNTWESAGLGKTDYGAVAGFGVGIPLGVASLSADLRYNLGLKDIGSTVSTKNRSIDLMVGVTF